jgi:hypothetical protein
MLHDPRHDKKPSLAGFALFVASKPADEAYHWPECTKCAVGQYLHSIDRYVPLAQWSGEILDMNVLAQGNKDHGFQTTAWTFGKLANRIFAYQMAQEKVTA